MRALRAFIAPLIAQQHTHTYIYLQLRRCEHPVKEVVSLDSKNMGQSISSEEMYRSFLSGNDDAFAELVALYENDLFSFINHIVNDYHEAKHLMIDSFARLALGGKNFSGKSSIKTYLFTIGKNLAYRNLRMRYRMQHISYEEIIDGLADEGETPPGFIERTENRRLLHNAMQNLKDEHRGVLICLYFEDMSYVEAGRAMRRSEKQIRGLAYRAKLALRRKLEESGYSRT
jgi:RNA polymerase sigma-70 factor (ECF subfamily)